MKITKYPKLISKAKSPKERTWHKSDFKIVLIYSHIDPSHPAPCLVFVLTSNNTAKQNTCCLLHINSEFSLVLVWNLSLIKLKYGYFKQRQISIWNLKIKFLIQKQDQTIFRKKIFTFFEEGWLFASTMQVVPSVISKIFFITYK